MAKLSENLNLQVPEPMDTVNRAYFEKLILDIDAKVASQEDLEKALDGSAIASKTVTDHSYKGSSKNVESALSSIDKALDSVSDTSKEEVKKVSEDLRTHKLAYGGTGKYGHVMLSDATDLVSSVASHTAATPLAVKKVNDLVGSVDTKVQALEKRISEVEMGGISLSSSTTSSSTTTGANSFAVKKAMDRADSAYSRAGTAISNASSARSRADSAYTKAEQAFQAGVEQKDLMAKSLTSRGADVSSTASWSDIRESTKELYAVKFSYESLKKGSMEHNLKFIPTEVVLNLTLTGDDNRDYYSTSLSSQLSLSVTIRSRKTGEPVVYIEREGNKLVFDKPLPESFSCIVHGVAKL